MVRGIPRVLLVPGSRDQSFHPDLSCRCLVLLCIAEMPARLLIIATLLAIVLPLLVGASVFFVALPWWIDRLLRFDPHIHERLRLDTSEDGLAWAVDHDRVTPPL